MVSPPEPVWEVLYDPEGRLLDNGEIVLARRRPRRKGMPRIYVTPMADVLVLALRQLTQPQAPGEIIVNKGNPAALRDTLLTRLPILGWTGHG